EPLAKSKAPPTLSLFPRGSPSSRPKLDTFKNGVGLGNNRPVAGLATAYSYSLPAAAAIKSGVEEAAAAYRPAGGSQRENSAKALRLASGFCTGRFSTAGDSIRAKLR